MEYATSLLHEHVVERNQRYILIWVQMNDHRFSILELVKLYRGLPQKYLDNLDALHVVHPSWSVRLLRLALWPICPVGFWDRFEAHERIEFLPEECLGGSLAKLHAALPKELIDYDKYLDTVELPDVNQLGMSGFAGMPPMPDMDFGDTHGAFQRKTASAAGKPSGGMEDDRPY